MVPPGERCNGIRAERKGVCRRARTHKHKCKHHSCRGWRRRRQKWLLSVLKLCRHRCRNVIECFLLEVEAAGGSTGKQCSSKKCLFMCMSTTFFKKRDFILKYHETNSSPLDSTTKELIWPQSDDPYSYMSVTESFFLWTKPLMFKIRIFFEADLK